MARRLGGDPENAQGDEDGTTAPSTIDILIRCQAEGSSFTIGLSLLANDDGTDALFRLFSDALRQRGETRPPVLDVQNWSLLFRGTRLTGGGGQRLSALGMDSGSVIHAVLKPADTWPKRPVETAPPQRKVRIALPDDVARQAPSEPQRRARPPAQEDDDTQPPAGENQQPTRQQEEEAPLLPPPRTGPAQRRPFGLALRNDDEQRPVINDQQMVEEIQRLGAMWERMQLTNRRVTNDRQQPTAQRGGGGGGGAAQQQQQQQARPPERRPREEIWNENELPPLRPPSGASAVAVPTAADAGDDDRERRREGDDTDEAREDGAEAPPLDAVTRQRAVRLVEPDTTPPTRTFAINVNRALLTPGLREILLIFFGYCLNVMCFFVLIPMMNVPSKIRVPIIIGGLFHWIASLHGVWKVDQDVIMKAA